MNSTHFRFSGSVALSLALSSCMLSPEQAEEHTGIVETASVTTVDRIVAGRPRPPVAVDLTQVSTCHAQRVRARICGDNGPSHPLDACELPPGIDPNVMREVASCRLELPCGEASESCHPAPSTLGREVCAELSSSCGTPCDRHLRTTLDRAGSYLRESVREAFLSCVADAKCGDVRACLAAIPSELIKSLEAAE